jgi:hypothetical protein
MDELGFDFNNSVDWFVHQLEQPYVLVKLDEAQANQLAGEIAAAIRRCYIPDEQLVARAAELGMLQTAILASKLPDNGSTMAGDFGEVLGYFYQSTKELPEDAIGAKKWRLKQDRTAPAPKSDVVHFVMPNHPDPSDQDALICSETKLKSTASNFNPIARAIEGCEKDPSRLAKTLVWLHERALSETLGDVDIQVLNRFINLTDHPQITTKYRAVAVICETLYQAELASAPTEASDEFTLVIIVVPNLQQTYEAVFAAAHATLPI